MKQTISKLFRCADRILVIGILLQIFLISPGWASGYATSHPYGSIEPNLQNQEVTGTITDAETNRGLPGVNIVVKGTTQGAVTDVNGVYSITIHSTDAILVFSMIGYQTQEIPVGNQTSIDLVMETDMEALDEVIVIGYGTQTKRELTGAVSRLSEEDFNESVSVSVDQMIEGKSPGVQVVQNSGEPGGGMSIDIRGVGSVSAGSAPLYVVDGLPIDNSVPISGTGNQVASNPSPRNPIAFLNPDDIASIEIMKDASATAIYGARGANGVIMITTKSGQDGQLMVDYNGHVGINVLHNRLNLLSPEEYMAGINALIDAGVGSEAERVTGIMDGGTDWQDVVFRDKAMLQKHNFSFSWGNGKTNYLVSLNNTREEGLLENTSFNRYSARFNVNHRTEKFNFGISSTSSYIQDIYVPQGFDVNLRGGAVNAAKLYDPTLSIIDENGDYVLTEFMDIDNPQAIISGNHMTGNRYRFLGTAYAEYFVVPSLSIKFRTGWDANNEDKLVYKDRTTIIGKSLGGVATSYNAMRSNYLMEGTMHYNKQIDEHKINVLAGVTSQRFIRTYNSQQATDFPTDATLAYNFGLANRETLVNSSSKSSNTLLSYLARVNYNYGNKYLLTASFRADGSSRFGAGSRWGYFPSFSAGWLMDQEEFFPMKEVFDMFKMRVSWGQTGNQEIGNYSSLITFGTGNMYVLDDALTTTLDPSRIANPDLKWETTTQIDVGIDFAILDRRVSGTIEWYQKNTTDMLLNLPVPTSSGFTSKRVNIGEMRNQGLEFGLSTYNVSTRNFTWSSDLNFYTLKNEVIDLGGIDAIYTGSLGAVAGNPAIITTGEPIYSFYGWEVEGVWQLGESDAASGYGVSPGDLKFIDQNNDGVINGDDRTVLGNSFPGFSWGFGNTFKYKAFGLHIFFKGVHGLSMLNANLLEQYYPRSGVRINRFADPFLNRWTPTNPTNEQPSYINTNQHSQAVNTINVEDASYVKLQTVRLSYTLPASTIKGIRSLEVYVSGLNLYTFSDYQGFDPALNPYGSANFRVDWNGYPSARTFLFGLNIGF